MASFEIQRSPEYSFAIILGIRVDFFDEHVCIDFDPYVSHHTGFDDLGRPAGIKGPMFVMVAKHCYWHTEPYQDRDD